MVLSNESPTALQTPTIISSSRTVLISYVIRFSALAIGFNGLRNPWIEHR